MKKTIYTPQHKLLVEKFISAHEKAGLRQEDAAKLLNKTQSCISKLDPDTTRRINPIQIQEFARIYKQPVSAFISQYKSFSKNLSAHRERPYCSPLPVRPPHNVKL